MRKKICNFVIVKTEQEINPTNVEAALYLFPVPLSDSSPIGSVLPVENAALLRGIKHFIVENVRSARRFLKKVDPATDIDSLTFTVLDEHTDAREVSAMLQPLREGHPMGVISEAGCPAVADPGADAVAVAQREGLKVMPLVGPSSILLALMGSGFNGQSFAFNGYLPIDATRRTARLSGNMLLCVASDLTGSRQSIVTRPLSQWAGATYNYDKIPTIFLLFS